MENNIFEELKKVKNNTELLSAEQWMEVISEAKKSSLRKAHKITKAYLLATCETIGILVEDAKYGREMKQSVRKNFTYEAFLKILTEKIPETLSKINSGVKMDDAIQDIVSDVLEIMEEE